MTGKRLKITSEIANKVGMRKGEWFKNVCLWEIYKSRPDAFDRCSSYEEVVAKGLIPVELLNFDGSQDEDEELLDLDF